MQFLGIEVLPKKVIGLTAIIPFKGVFSLLAVLRNVNGCRRFVVLQAGSYLNLS